eukprot:3614274-Prymnesium_polylepis.1
MSKRSVTASHSAARRTSTGARPRRARAALTMVQPRPRPSRRARAALTTPLHRPHTTLTPPSVTHRPHTALTPPPLRFAHVRVVSHCGRGRESLSLPLRPTALCCCRQAQSSHPSRTAACARARQVHAAARVKSSQVKYSVRYETHGKDTGSWNVQSIHCRPG